MPISRKLVSLVLVTVVGCLFGAEAWAGVSFTLSGSANDSHLGLSDNNTLSGSANISVDLGSYVRLGFTHRRQSDDSEGEKVIINPDGTATNMLASFSESKSVVANSLDLTVVLYQGEIVTPFIFGGFVKKTRKVYAEQDGLVLTDYTETDPSPKPHGGLGLAIALNQHFSIRFSKDWSTGIHYRAGEEKPRAIYDTYTEVGITYRL